jgi:hypothetical protein
MEDEVGRAYRDMIVMPEQRQLRRPRRTWENNSKIDLREIGFCGVE